VPFYRAKGRSAMCPLCSMPIRRNHNSADESLFAVQVMGLVFFVLAGVYFSAWALVGAAVFCAVLAVRIWYRGRFLKEWRQWIANEHAR
jgi:hypothetical protein